MSVLKLYYVYVLLVRNVHYILYTHRHSHTYTHTFETISRFVLIDELWFLVFKSLETKESCNVSY